MKRNIKLILKYLIAITLYGLAFTLLDDAFHIKLIAFILIMVGIEIQRGNIS